MDKKISAVVVMLVLLALVFSGCNENNQEHDENKIKGTWVNSEFYENNTRTITYIFLPNKTFEITVSYTGDLIRTSGKWKIADNKLVLDITEPTSMTITSDYQFSNNYKIFTITNSSGNTIRIDLVKFDSMSPVLNEGDLVAWTPIDIDQVEVGDIVVFKSYVNSTNENLVIHRVSKILTESETGRPILETKGDNNTWTDQAGPHIPEPYIREDHLMGKVISVDQQPLKVPFIGNFGLWVNKNFQKQ